MTIEELGFISSVDSTVTRSQCKTEYSGTGGSHYGFSTKKSAVTV